MARGCTHLELFVYLLLAGVVWPVGHCAEAFEEQPWWRGNGMQGDREERSMPMGRADYPDAASLQRDGRYWSGRDGSGASFADGYISGNRELPPRPELLRPLPQEGRGYGAQGYSQGPRSPQTWSGDPEYGMTRFRGDPYARPGREQWNGEAFFPVRPPHDGRGYPVDDRGYPAESRGYPAESRGYPVEGRGYPVEGRGYPVESRGYPTDNWGYGVGDRLRSDDDRRAERSSPWQVPDGAALSSAQSIYSRNALLENRAGRPPAAAGPGEPSRSAFAVSGDRAFDDRSGPNGIPWR
ncbi:MAG: hypothetical protein H7835_12490 [Magnetococcus sp. XQGC-1]